jgi:hypothetical protein
MTKNRPHSKAALVFIVALFISSTLLLAQHFVMMNDEERIELALDMTRKGVQQQSTTKILRVLASASWAEGKVFPSKAGQAKLARSGNPAGIERA